MSPVKINTVDDFAIKIREILDLNTPIDIEQVVTLLLGEIVYDNTIKKRETKIEKLDGSKLAFRITLRKSVSEAENRFKIAHKIGHLFLHMGYLIDEAEWEESPLYQDSAYYRLGHNKEEYEANEFAAALLMTKKEFFERAKKSLVEGVYHIKEIATHFNVPEDIVIIRGHQLGLFSWN